ncbi:MAG TPA: PPOX class F420-dependent oxidoreductase, partial [Kofleriaceae bacterium]
MSSLEQLSSEKYVLVTTFRKDGRAVATPLWGVPNGAGLAIWTPRDTGKVKRIRNSGRVTVAACDARGNVHGEAVDGQARIGDQADRLRIGKALTRKYGWSARLILLGSRLRRGVHGTIAV